MITGEENILQLAEMGRGLKPIFEKHGLASYFKEENLQKIGRFMKLRTLMDAKGLNADLFIELLNNTVNTDRIEVCSDGQVNENLHFSSMLPCGLRNPFKEYFESLIFDNQEQYGSLNYLVEGNVNHELSYYPLLDSITNHNELPDIIMASDVNNFFHRPFMQRFVEKGVFSSYMPYKPNSYLDKVAYADPENCFTMYTANMLVMVIDNERLNGKSIPKRWSDILDSSFHNEIAMRGEENFFCNAVMLPFYKENGFDAIRQLANNIKSGMHPAEMVKLAGAGKQEGAAVYIMPYFFAKKIKKENVTLVWPEDGAIASPVFMLVKKHKQKEHEKLLSMLMSKETGSMMLGRHFPTMHPDITHESLPEAVKWLGWDFLYSNDIGLLKNDIRDAFLEVWNTKTVAI